MNNPALTNRFSIKFTCIFTEREHQRECHPSKEILMPDPEVMLLGSLKIYITITHNSIYRALIIDLCFIFIDM